MEHTALAFLLNMAAAAALLIWAVRLVRTGIERAYGGHLRAVLRRSTSHRLSAAASGAGAAVLMQSSTAVVMLMAGFVAAGSLGGVAGLAIVLGADLGSAIVVQILNSRLALVMPVLLLAGVLIFLRSNQRSVRQFGRVMIGLALVFMSLDMIRAASTPLAENDTARMVMVYLSSDLVSAFLIAAIFAWLVHSSVASVLLFATLAAQGILPPDAALAMVLGANLGGAVIAVVLTLQMNATVRQIVWTNLVLRGGGAALTLAFLPHVIALLGTISADPGQQALYLHLIYNTALLTLALPFIRPLMHVAARILPEKAAPADPYAAESALDPALQDQPGRAYACVTRELVQIGGMIEKMHRRAVLLFDRYDQTAAAQVQTDAQRIAARALEIRVYLSRIRTKNDADATAGQPGSGRATGRAFELATIAVNMETGADVVARKLVGLAKRMDRDKLRFSEAGAQDVSDFHDIVLRNIQHGISVLMSEDVGLARELVEQKEAVREAAQRFERRHLERLRAGQSESLETSAIHLDVLRSLKTLNAAFAVIAYPVLQERGELLDSRLASA